MMALLRVVFCCVVITEAVLRFDTATQLSFSLDNVDVRVNAENQVTVVLPDVPEGWSVVPVTQIGDPDIPALQNAVLLSTSEMISSEQHWMIAVSNVEYSLQHISGVLAPRQHGIKLCGNITAEVLETDAYSNNDVWYPDDKTVAKMHNFHTFRDVQGALLRINAVQYNPFRHQIRVLKRCTINIHSLDNNYIAYPRSVDPDFAKLYQFLYGNAAHHQHNLIPRDAPGAVLVINEARFQSVAEDYMTWVKSRGFTAYNHTLQHENSTQLKTGVVASLYKQHGVAFLLLLGKKVPFVDLTEHPHGIAHFACDQCYGQLGGYPTADLAVTRLSVDTLADAQGQLKKIKAYNPQPTWIRKLVGAAIPDGDLYATEKNVANTLNNISWNTTVVYAKESTKRQVVDEVNNGVGIFSYMGHGSGTEMWNLKFNNSDAANLQNHGKPFFLLDTACHNGQFETYHPCLNEAMMSHPTGGAIAAIGGTDEEEAWHSVAQTCAAKMIVNNTATRLGPWMTGALMCMWKIITDPESKWWSLQETAVFGDPTMDLKF